MDVVEDTVKAYQASLDDYVLRHMDIEAVREEADLFLSRIGEEGKILDVGCGPGRDAIYFRSKGYFVSGIDLVPEFIELAQANSPWGNFYVMDMRRMEFDNSSFDGLWSMASILHVPKEEHESTMREYARVLKPRGIMFLSTMEGYCESILSGPKYGKGSKHFFPSGEQELRDLVTSVGFEIDQFEGDRKTISSKGPFSFFNVLAHKKE